MTEISKSLLRGESFSSCQVQVNYSECKKKLFTCVVYNNICSPKVFSLLFVLTGFYLFFFSFEQLYINVLNEKFILIY